MGIVILCASGSAAFTILTIACHYMDNEFHKMMSMNTFLFSDSLTGVGIITALTVLGWVLGNADQERAEQVSALVKDSAEQHSR